MKEEMMGMKQDTMDMKEQTNLNTALIISNEVSSLYIQYIVKPVLFQVLGDISWDNFCTKLSALESQLDNSQIKAMKADKPIDNEKFNKPLVQFLESIQKS